MEASSVQEKNTNAEICKVLKINPRTIDHLKKKLIEKGIDEVMKSS
jgi:DNA-binding CsgD family transcriptional regulator